MALSEATRGRRKKAAMTACEDLVTERVFSGRSILGLYPATDERNLEAFAEWRKKNGR